jgi:alpha-L-fucosidase
MRPGLYRADLDSLRQHRVPDWFADAKLGAFVHWGLFSVPGFAPTTRYTDVLHHDYDRAMVVSPYAEAYANAMRVPGTPTYEFHRATYGDMAYEGSKRSSSDNSPTGTPTRGPSSSGGRVLAMW